MRTDATSSSFEHAHAHFGGAAQRRVTARDEDLDRLQHYARALLHGALLPEDVDEDWPEFFRLVEAFVQVCASARLRRLRAQASLFEGWGDEPLTDGDRAFLLRLLHEVHDDPGARDPKSEKARTTR